MRSDRFSSIAAGIAVLCFVVYAMFSALARTEGPPETGNRMYKTGVGDFLVEWDMGRYADGTITNDGGYIARGESIKTPNGNFLKGFPFDNDFIGIVDDIVEIDGTVFLLASRLSKGTFIYRYQDGAFELVKHATRHVIDPLAKPSVGVYSLGIEKCEGLLVYSDGQWNVYEHDADVER